MFRYTFIALFLMLVSLTAWASPPSEHYSRGIGVSPLSKNQRDAENFDPRESAGLFVGVRYFVDADGGPSGDITEVPFAVDDAVDLAYLFSIELGLLEPNTVTLALSGEPQKPESSERLEELVAAGALRTDASFIKLLSLVSRTTRDAGERGLIVLSFATHGYRIGGDDRLLAQDSSIATLDLTGIPVRTVLDNASTSVAPRRLVLLDACRERVVRNTRTIEDSASAMSETLVKAISEASGLAVLSGTTAGGFSYDDPKIKNGVFTSSIIAGLRGEASTDERGFITPASLAAFVDKTVRHWVLRNRPEHSDRSAGIQYTTDDVRSGQMPLVATPTAMVSEAITLANDLTADLLAESGPSGVRFRSFGNAPEPWSRYTGPKSSRSGPGVGIFAEDSERQWVVIVGTNPEYILFAGDRMPRTEEMDAADVLDWFIDPKIYGKIPPQQLLFLSGSSATSEVVLKELEAIEQEINPEDSLLFYFSGHGTEFIDPGEMLLYDAFSDGEWGRVESTTRGLLTADFLIGWMNRLQAKKVVAILDSGGPGFEQASRHLDLAKGRYVISNINGRTTIRNGFLTWFVLGTVREARRATTIELLGSVLSEADRLLSEKGSELYFYARGDNNQRESQ